MTKTARIVIISVGCPNGSTQISLKKSIRPYISTGVQKTITVAIAMRMFAHQEASRNCRRNMNTEPTRQPIPINIVTG